VYGILRELHHLAAVRTGYRPHCEQCAPTKPSATRTSVYPENLILGKVWSFDVAYVAEVSVGVV
jgi:hypothetical protein